MPEKDIRFRREAQASDEAAVRAMAAATGFFHDDEVDVAVELVQERLAKGDASGYHFVFAELGGRAVGYACFGPIACTRSSFDLYWIVVEPAFQGQGMGRRIMAEAETSIRALGGTRVYVETSSRELYAPTRTFYLRTGYREEARLPAFYAPDDDLVIYVREL